MFYVHSESKAHDKALKAKTHTAAYCNFTADFFGHIAEIIIHNNDIQSLLDSTNGNELAAEHERSTQSRRERNFTLLLSFPAI